MFQDRVPHDTAKNSHNLKVVFLNFHLVKYEVFVTNKDQKACSVAQGDHILILEKEDTAGQDGDTGQTDTHDMNGKCRKQEPNPRRFPQFKNPASNAFI